MNGAVHGRGGMQARGPLCPGGIATEPRALALAGLGWEQRLREILKIRELGTGPWAGRESGDVEKETELA